MSEAENADTQTVYVRAKRGGGTATVLHTKRGCRLLAQARAVHEYRRASFPADTPVCRACADTVEPVTQGNGGPWECLDALDPDALATDGGHPGGDRDGR